MGNVGAKSLQSRLGAANNFCLPEMYKHHGRAQLYQMAGWLKLPFCVTLFWAKGETSTSYMCFLLGEFSLKTELLSPIYKTYNRMTYNTSLFTV